MIRQILFIASIFVLVVSCTNDSKYDDPKWQPVMTFSKIPKEQVIEEVDDSIFSALLKNNEDDLWNAYSTLRLYAGAFLDSESFDRNDAKDYFKREFALCQTLGEFRAAIEFLDNCIIYEGASAEERYFCEYQRNRLKACKAWKEENQDEARRAIDLNLKMTSGKLSDSKLATLAELTEYSETDSGKYQEIYNDLILYIQSSATLDKVAAKNYVKRIKKDYPALSRLDEKFNEVIRTAAFDNLPIY